MNQINEYTKILPDGGLAIRVPKRIAEIKLCGGAFTIYIDDTMTFEMPTEEQRENLKKLLCIEIIPYEENT
jgi:hypothetical protein